MRSKTDGFFDGFEDCSSSLSFVEVIKTLAFQIGMQMGVGGVYPTPALKLVALTPLAFNVFCPSFLEASGMSFPKPLGFSWL